MDPIRLDPAHSAEKGVSVSISGVSKSYGSVAAVADFSLEIGRGEFLTLLGPSGSGKTSLLMIIAGFLRPDRGSIKFGDREVVRTPPHKRNVAMVFQNYALFPHMNVAENIAYPLKVRHVGREDIRRKVKNALALVQMSDYETRKVDQLSGGQRQRVALARAMVFEPDVLLLDEPLSALDKKLRGQMQLEIRRLHKQLGMTTIAVTHDQREALTMSDRVAVMNGGHLIQVDTPDAIYERPSTIFVASFVGESYFLPVEVENGVVAINGRALTLAAPPPKSDKSQLLLLRPEKLRFMAEGEEPGLNRFQGRVKDVVFEGESVVFLLDVEGKTEVAVRYLNRSIERARMPAPGAAITLGLHPDDTLVMPAT